jgi:hypothetical protein
VYTLSLLGEESPQRQEAIRLAQGIDVFKGDVERGALPSADGEHHWADILLSWEWNRHAAWAFGMETGALKKYGGF